MNGSYIMLAAILRKLGETSVVLSPEDIMVARDSGGLECFMDESTGNMTYRLPRPPADPDQATLPLDTVPEPPWEVGPQNANNAKRAGWQAYYNRQSRRECPFPLARGDLLQGFEEGWDAAAKHQDETLNQK